jgi:hypothetical protein
MPKEQKEKKVTVTKKVYHYAKAVAEWTAAGMPTRTDEEVTAIFNAFCKPCSHYIGGGCRLCGCRVNQGNVALTNKIKMKTESCPKKKW